MRKKKYAYGGQTQDGSQLGMLSTVLGAGSMIPSPASPFLMAGSAIAGIGSSYMASKYAKEEQAKIDAEARKEQDKIDMENNNSILANYPTKGIYGSQMYKYGGMLKKYQDGGLLPISMDASLAVGDSHNEDTNGDGQGGIPIGQNQEVEDKEVVTNDGKVFSHRLGYAKKASKIIASPMYKKFELEKNKNTAILENKVSTEVDKNTANRNIGKMVNPLDVLFAEQEMVATKMGLREDTKKMAYGGYLDPKLFPSTTSALNTTNSYIPNPLIVPSSENVEEELGIYNNKPLGWNPTYSNNSGSGVLKPTIDTRTPYQKVLPTTSKTLDFGQNNTSTTNNTTDVTDTTPTPNSYDNLGNNVLQASRFIDNIANRAITANTPDVPRPRLLNNRGLNTTYDISANLAENRANTNAGMRNIDAKTTDIGLALSNKQGLKVNELKEAGKLYQHKTNIENQLKNDNSKFMTNIESQNNALLNKYSYDKMNRQDYINRQNSANFANLSGDLQKMQQDKSMSDNDKMAIEMYAKALNNGGTVDRNFKEILIRNSGITEARYEELFGK